jgi:hypothetical protein
MHDGNCFHFYFCFVCFSLLTFIRSWILFTFGKCFPHLFSRSTFSKYWAFERQMILKYFKLNKQINKQTSFVFKGCDLPVFPCAPWLWEILQSFSGWVFCYGYGRLQILEWGYFCFHSLLCVSLWIGRVAGGGGPRKVPQAADPVTAYLGKQLCTQGCTKCFKSQRKTFKTLGDLPLTWWG